MNNTNFLKEVEKTTKEVNEVVTAVTITVVSVITTVKLIRKTFFNKSKQTCRGGGETLLMHNSGPKS